MKHAILVGLVAGLFVVVAFQHRQVNRFRADNERLAEAATEVEQLKGAVAQFASLPTVDNATTEIARLREENHDLLKLRNEVSQLRRQKSEFDKLRAENERLRDLAKKANASSSQGSMKPILTRKENFSNQGFRTPEATVHTFFWARRQNDVQALSNCLLPESWNAAIRGNAGLLEGGHFVPYLAEQFAKTTAIGIVARRNLSGEVVQLGIEITFDGNPGSQKVALTLKRTGDDWKLDLKELF
jgi:uncharacterized protein YdcH (DUF465 family)